MERKFRANEGKVLRFSIYLRGEEKSKATIEKYERDVRKFLSFCDQSDKTIDQISKDIVLDYKEMLMGKYEPSSVNSMLAALNQYLLFIGKGECKVKQIKIQRKAFLEDNRCLTREEARRLIDEAERIGKERLKVMIETLCDTGIRVSELEFFTVKRIEAGIIKIHNKGKTRVIALTSALRIKLLRYAEDNHIKKGLIFITKTGNKVDRSNFWREIREMCARAGVIIKKGFPHNFRRLFARNYYELEKDIVSLANIMGHSNIETTRLYIMVTYQEFVEKFKRIKSISKK